VCTASIIKPVTKPHAKTQVEMSKLVGQRNLGWTNRERGQERKKGREPIGKVAGPSRQNRKDMEEERK
jgi:hypothetical protein